MNDVIACPTMACVYQFNRYANFDNWKIFEFLNLFYKVIHFQPPGPQSTKINYFGLVHFSSRILNTKRKSGVGGSL